VRFGVVTLFYQVAMEHVHFLFNEFAKLIILYPNTKYTKQKPQQTLFYQVSEAFIREAATRFELEIAQKT